MANNRLYIKDLETGERFLIAKSWGDGWICWHHLEMLTEWFGGRDGKASYGNTSNTKSNLMLETENERL